MSLFNTTAKSSISHGYFSLNMLFLFFAVQVLFSSNILSQDDLFFSRTPIWTSGSTYGGGDGNAQWLDVDNDGDPDLVTSVPNPRRWAIFLNEKGTMASIPYWESSETTDCDHISVLDFDQDGLEDLAATHESHCTIYLNDRSKNKMSFSATPDWETGFYTDANQIDFGDYDKDGDLDLLMASGMPIFGLAIFKNEGGVISKTVSQKLGPRAYSESSIFADIDSDNDLDIIATYSKKGTIIVFKNDGGGQFDIGSEVYKDEEVVHVQRVYSIDIDQDGVNEIFCAKGPWGPPGSSVGLAQNGSGTYQVIWRSGKTTGYHGFDFQDIDQDGDLDMAAADWPGKSVSVYLQENGKFPELPSWKTSTSGNAHEVDFADMDGDGDLDLAVGCRDQAMVYENLKIPPLAREILQRAIDAIGGDQALERLKSQMMWMERGTYYGMGDGIPYTAQYSSMWPNWYRKEVEDSITLAINGNEAWVSGQGGDHKLEKDLQMELVKQARVAWAVRLFPLKDKDYDLVSLDDLEMDGKKLIGFKAMYPDGRDILFYFDQETYLLNRIETSIVTPEYGEQTVRSEVFFEDYKSFGGILMPSKYKVYYDKKLFADAEVIDYKLFATLDPALFHAAK